MVHPAQLAFAFEFAQPSAEFDEEHPTRIIVPAYTRQAPATNAPRSVFEMARVFAEITRPTADHEEPKNQATRAFRIVREFGVTRYTAIPVQETEEWREREEARRARQKPPKPPKAAKTRSRKLMELVGEGG